MHAWRGGNREYTTGAAETASPMSNHLVISEWPLNREQTLRVSLHRFGNRNFLHVRTWFFGDANELRPGQSGIVVDMKYLPMLTDAIAKAYEVADELGGLS
jgi:hypothetical protein